MNIGDKDADGWTYVRFGDAAKAAQDGAHEVSGRLLGKTVWMSMFGSGAAFYSHWEYRIREKARTITVTIPRPYSSSFSHNSNLIGLSYQSFSDAQTAYKTICAAMEQS